MLTLMYHNCTYRQAVNRSSNFSVRCPDILFDKRMAFVESVCDTLIKSRFGAGCSAAWVVEMRSETENVGCFDLMDTGLVSLYELDLVRLHTRPISDAARREAMRQGPTNILTRRSNSPAGSGPNAAAMPYLGRGSP
jgi:hypothetical protein